MKKFSAFVRSHLGTAIAATATAVVIVGGVLVLVLVGTGGSSTVTATNPATTSTTVSPAIRGAKSATGARRQGVRGTIIAINGDTWTVTSARGTPVTVDVSAATTYGTTKAAQSVSDFAVGDRIVAIGSRTGSTVSATRIAMAATAGAGSPTSTSTP